MSERVKVAVEVPNSIVGQTVETMWAETTADGYRLLNTPWYAKGLSYLDVVQAAPASDGSLQFCRKLGTAGHSTYRLLLENESTWKSYWGELESLGCTYEESTNDGLHLLAVDVPPECDIYEAYALMEAGEHAGAWQFEEGDVNHTLKGAN